MSETRAEWDTAYINNLPDSAFAYIEAGGEKDDEGKTTPRSKRHFPHHNAAGELDTPHLRNALSRGPQSSVWPNGQQHLERHASAEGVGGRAERPPRDQLVRSQADFELRDEGTELPTLNGHFAVFNRWTEIHSMYEGHFLERVAPGAFAKAFGDWKANPNTVRVTFNHGRDPQLGDKVLGIPEMLEEDDFGARYEVPLFDTAYNRELLPGLKAGAYGSSFRFRVVDDDFVKRPPEAEHNPDRLPERTVKAVQLFEFGPVTYPAYADATAGVRSLTDDYIRMVLGAPAVEAAAAHLASGSKEPAAPAPSTTPRLFRSDEEWLAYLETL